MFSPSLSSALCALFLASSFAAPALSRPSPASGPFTRLRHATASRLKGRDGSDYLDNIVYIDQSLDAVYLAIDVEQQTYAAYLDSSWSGLMLYDGKYDAQEGDIRDVTIDETVTVKVDYRRESISIWDMDIDVSYYSAGSWPEGLPKVAEDGVKMGYLGTSMSQPNNTLYSYYSGKWPQDYSKWYYDTLMFYDWSKGPSNSSVDIAGVMVPGETLSWDGLGLDSGYVSEYGLPDLGSVSKQPYVYTRPDGTIYIDNYIYVSDQKYSANTQVYQADSSKLVVAIDSSNRWSLMPSDLVEKIYGSVSGAQVVAGDKYHYYTLPCDSEIKLEIVIDSVKYQVFTEVLIAPNPQNKDQCIGSIFMPGGGAVDARPEWDIIFGFQFMSAFYYRCGFSSQSNTPYYKFLPLQPSNDNWKTMAPMNDYTSAYGSYASTAAYTTTTGWASSASNAVSSSPSWTGASSSSAWSSSAPAHTWASSSSSGHAWSPSSSSSSGHAWSSSSSSGSYASSTVSSYNAYSTAGSSDYDADRTAGNLAAQGAVENDGSSSEDGWEKKAKLYQIIIIVLASLLGLGIVGGIIAAVVGRRKKDTARPSAYRNIHDAEASESKGALYGAEGGTSRYADPYADNH